MPAIKVDDILYVRLRAPDLDKMESFLVDFGMQPSAKTGSALYMRGTDPSHHIHITEKGAEPGLIGLGFRAVSEADLNAVAQSTGAAVEDSDEPGGGKRVRLTDPNGFRIEVVHGLEQLAPLPVPEPITFNTGDNRARQNRLQRVHKGPSHVKRLGHVALNCVDNNATRDWYAEHLGLIDSDRVVAEPGGPVFGTFMRCDVGDRPVDHHTLLVAIGGDSSLNHMGFEVHDMDDVGAGQQHLYDANRHHLWGIGRHTLGGQIYDYWRDPWGHGIEHWTDGDLLDATIPAEEHGAEEALLGQWGPIPPSTFGQTTLNEEYAMGKREN